MMHGNADLPTVAALPGLLTAIHDDLATTSFVLGSAASAEADVLRTRILTQIDAHLLPRAGGKNIPVVAVLGGSTGAGKSTLINSLLRKEVSEAGVLRPTTREAVLAHHPETSIAHVPLADRTRAVTNLNVPKGLALIDAPDLDSYDDTNRKAAAELIEAADLWLFVTTAARYGDAIPWQNLTEAHDRGLQVAVVFNRVPQKILSTVRMDLMQRLNEAGLGDVPMFVVPDVGPHEGMLESHDVDELRSWLRLATEGEQGRGIIARTTRGAWSALKDNIAELTRAYVRQAHGLEHLSEIADTTASAIAVDLTTALRAGATGVGAPTTRWLAAVSASGALSDLMQADPRQAKPGLGGRRTKRRTQAAIALGQETAAAIRTVLADAIHDVANQITQLWIEAEVGAETMMRGIPQLSIAQAGQRADKVLRSWQQELDAVVDQKVASEVMSASAVAHLLAAGIGGVRGAAELATALVGAETVSQGRELLTKMCTSAVAAAATPYHKALGNNASLSRHVVTGLRLRLAELERYVDAVAA
ncbi:MAG: 50S ribosome-binding GTPase [Bowdeniella nasicola]|nr:50S ribosome-binding GTPase [Bowdeniella nasicola]